MPTRPARSAGASSRSRSAAATESPVSATRLPPKDPAGGQAAPSEILVDDPRRPRIHHALHHQDDQQHYRHPGGPHIARIEQRTIAPFGHEAGVPDQDPP